MNLSPCLIQKITDADNKPISGAQLFWYVSGSLVNAPTYASNNGSTNPQPLLTDIDGSFVAWLDPSIIYDVQIKSPTGVLIKTIEEISGSSGGSGSSDWKVKVNSGDSSPDFLSQKIQAQDSSIALFTNGTFGNPNTLGIEVKLSTDPLNALRKDASGLLVTPSTLAPYIRKDGLTTTEASIPFAHGISVTEEVKFNSIADGTPSASSF